MKRKELDGIEPSIKSIQDHLTLHEVDCSFFGPEIHTAIKSIAKMNQVKEETVLFVMLPILATALGMHTFIDAGNRPITTKPNVYMVNLLNSGGAKSQITNLLLKNTLKRLDNALQEETERLINMITVDKQNGPIFNSTDRDSERKRIRLTSHHALISKGSAESLFHFGGNGAMMLIYDELATFIDMFIVGDRNITMLTELYQSHSVKKVLISRETASVEDSAISLYAHGTPQYGKSLVTDKMKKDGSCWRFWINIDTPEPISLSLEEFMNSEEEEEVPDFSTFDRLFTSIVNQHFKRQSEWIYKYDKKALDQKKIVFKTLKWLSLSLDERDSTMKTILLKLPAIIDKCALIHAVVKYNLEDKSVFNAMDTRQVGEESFEFGWQMARKVFTGWMELIQLRDSKTDDEGLQKFKLKKPSVNSTYYQELLQKMGGPGVYPKDKFEFVLSSIGFKNRMDKTRFRNFLNANPNLIIDIGKEIMINNE